MHNSTYETFSTFCCFLLVEKNVSKTLQVQQIGWKLLMHSSYDALDAGFVKAFAIPTGLKGCFDWL